MIKNTLSLFQIPGYILHKSLRVINNDPVMRSYDFLSRCNICCWWILLIPITFLALAVGLITSEISVATRTRLTLEENTHMNDFETVFGFLLMIWPLISIILMCCIPRFCHRRTVSIWSIICFCHSARQENISLSIKSLLLRSFFLKRSTLDLSIRSCTDVIIVIYVYKVMYKSQASVNGSSIVPCYNHKTVIVVIIMTYRARFASANVAYSLETWALTFSFVFLCTEGYIVTKEAMASVWRRIHQQQCFAAIYWKE